MQLREVVLVDIPTLPGFEHHIFRCSACPQVSRRLVVCRAKMPVMEPLIARDRPVSNLQVGPPPVRSARPDAVEKLHSTQMAPEEHEPPNWRPAVERLTIALKERAVASRASAWAKTVKKVRSAQKALGERTA
jgi:hypothetical protein